MQIIYYIIVLVLFILDIYIIYLDPYLSDLKEIKELKKIEFSKEVINSENGSITYINYPNRILTKIEGNKFNISASYIDIKDKCNVDEIIFDGVKFISNLNLTANHIEFINSSYYEKDGVIFDLNNNISFIYKELNNKSLKDLVNNYSINKCLLNKLSDAYYIQYSFSSHLLRISYPYDKIPSIPSLIIPKEIENDKVLGVEINFPKLDYLYINENINQIIFERNVEINHIELDSNNKYLKIRNNKLVYRKFNIYVKNIYDKKNIEYYKPYYLFKHYNLNNENIININFNEYLINL